GPMCNLLAKFLQLPSHTCAPLTIEEAWNTTDLQGTHNVAIVYNLESREPQRKLYSLLNPTLRINLVFAIGLPRVFGSTVLVRDGFNVTLSD
ncbi:hypothetical protein ACTXT7_017588, partial [Hymenolepis weldensis]